MIGKKCALRSPNQTAAIVAANIRHHDLVVSMCSSRHHYCPLQLFGAHGTTPHPIQSFACLQKAAIADALAIHSATNIPHSKDCTVTEVQITAPVILKNLLNVIEWASESKTLGMEVVTQNGAICKVKGTHRTSCHDDQDLLSSLYINP
jgi:hypothetical protein